MKNVSEYRAWDEDNKRMWYSSQCGEEYNNSTFNMGFIFGTGELEMVVIDYNPLTEKVDNICYADNGTPEYVNRILPKMRFTGLFDKNRVEIYEGDIIKCPCYSRKDVDYWVEVVKIGQFKLEGSARYIYEIDGAYVKDIGDYGVPLREIMNMEVVGNIFENLELLEGED